jgi:hypothetical protein
VRFTFNPNRYAEFELSIKFSLGLFHQTNAQETLDQYEWLYLEERELFDVMKWTGGNMKVGILFAEKTSEGSTHGC